MLKPLYNKVIVEIIKEEEDQPSGLIYIPGKQNPYYKGIVTGVGDGHYQNAKRIAMDVNVGDVVLFLKNSGLGVQFNSTNDPTHILLSDTDLYAIEVAD